ncbi:hypothetical protein CCB80_01655 [Armatimonadetes bacterium Uphvl-Ar1]|nr:hypothetical protein CCB80_01655 [Armatimonadetes bacterium Uphvl-Ar1]
MTDVNRLWILLAWVVLGGLLGGCSQVENRTSVGADGVVKKSITISENMAGAMGGVEMTAESLRAKLKLPGDDWEFDDLSDEDEVKIRVSKVFDSLESAAVDFELAVSEDQSVLGRSEFLVGDDGAEFVERYAMKVPLPADEVEAEIVEGAAKLREAWTIGELTDAESRRLSVAGREILMNAVFGPSEPLFPILVSSPGRFEREVRLRCFEPMTELFLSVDGVSEEETRGMVLSFFKVLDTEEEFGGTAPKIEMGNEEEEKTETTYSIQVVFSSPNLVEGNGRFDVFQGEYFWDFYSMRLETSPIEMRVKFRR